MQQLTLIRHGLTKWNEDGRFQGHSDIPLSAEGRAQAERLELYLRALDIDKVFASPLRRARETAAIAFPAHTATVDPRLMELDFGEFEGHTLVENQRHPRWEWWSADSFGRRAPGGESYSDLRERTVAWFQELTDVTHAAAVTHSGAIQMLLSYLLGVEYPRWRKRFFLGQTSLTRILFSGDEAVIERVNDTRHLLDDTFDPLRD